MKPWDKQDSMLRAAVLVSLATEAASLLATQNQAIRLRSPWQDDPYNAGVCFALAALPFLGVMLAIRLVSRALARRPRVEAVDEQLTRAAAAVAAVVDVLMLSEWTAVATGQHRAAWNGITASLIAILAVITVASTALTVGVLRARVLRRGTSWDTDWLDDLALVAERLPGVDARALVRPIEWVRRRAITVFIGGSALCAVAVVGAMAYGERWTNPWLILWAYAIDVTSNLLVCLAGNAIAGFIRRPPRLRPNLAAALTAGGLAAVASEAFHTQIWDGLTGHDPGSVATMTQLTSGAALIVAATTYPISVALRRRSPGART